MSEQSTRADDSLLVQSCLARRPFSWQRFVDRFLPVVLLAIQEIDSQSSRGWEEPHHQQLARMVMEQIQANDFELLGTWNDDIDMETWLVIVTRRFVIGTGRAEPDSDS